MNRGTNATGLSFWESKGWPVFGNAEVIHLLKHTITPCIRANNFDRLEGVGESSARESFS